MMPTRFIGADGHETRLDPASTQLAAAAVSTTTAGTISGTTSAGAAPTVTVTFATDRSGSFLLNPVTGGGAQAAGQVCTVRFVKEYSAIPSSVTVSGMNETDTTATIVFAVGTITTKGFDVIVGTALTTAKAYRVQYSVQP